MERKKVSDFAVMNISNDYIDEILITREQIDKRIKEIAQQIRKDYINKDLLVLGVLNGAAPTVCELSFSLDPYTQMDWIACSSYGNSTESSGIVKFLKEPSISIEGKHVLVVDDISDTNYTSQALKEYLLNKGVASVEFFMLLQKQGAQKIDLDIKYIGFDIPNKYVVGYGLDGPGGIFRNLNFIGVLNPKYF